MPLNARQRRAYNHLCNVYASTRVVGAGARPGAETLTLAGSSVACHYEKTPNLDDPSGAGVGDVQGKVLFSTDSVHFAADAPITNNCILRDVTLLPDGTQSPSYGKYHRVLGEPRMVPDSGARRANKLSVMAMEMEHPPAALPA